MGDVGSFAGHVLLNWWTLLAGVMVAVEPVARLLWHGYDRWAATWLLAPRRKRLARIGALAAFVVANYLAYHEAKEEARMAQNHSIMDTGRHLKTDQQSRMMPEFQLSSGETYSIQINSLPNCDECEVYAQELRDFVGAIPGWKVGGSALFLVDPAAPREGMYLILNSDLRPELRRKLFAAFAAGSIPLSIRTPQTFPDLDAAIVVARRAKQI
jgi:hypothetical protein